MKETKGRDQKMVVNSRDVPERAIVICQKGGVMIFTKAPLPSGRGNDWAVEVSQVTRDHSLKGIPQGSRAVIGEDKI